jgi:hypothetical protein
MIGLSNCSTLPEVGEGVGVGVEVEVGVGVEVKVGVGVELTDGVTLEYDVQ